MEAGSVHVYRLKRRYRYFYFGLGVFMALLGLGLGAWGLGSDDVGFRGIMILLGVAVLLLGGATMASMHRFRYVLSDEAIERHGLAGVKRLVRHDIIGRRSILIDHGPPMTRLLSGSPRSPYLDLHVQLDTDAHFQSWVKSLPDLDQQEVQRSLDEYLQSDDGLSGDEKRVRLAAAHRISKIFTGVTFASFAWCLFYPHPYELALGLAALLPIAAILFAARAGAAYSLNPKNNDVRAHLLLPLYLPGGALALRALFDTLIFDWQALVWNTLILTASFMLFASLLVKSLREEKTGLWSLGFLMLFYGYGASALANKVLDRSAPQVFPTRVLDMHVSSGKSTSYYLKLAPWGPQAESEEVDGGQEIYDRVRKGGTVCVYLWPGALKMRWFEVWECPR